MAPLHLRPLYKSAARICTGVENVEERARECKGGARDASAKPERKLGELRCDVSSALTPLITY